MEEKKGFMFSCDIEPTEESKEQLTKLLHDEEQEKQEQLERVKRMLMQLAKLTVADYMEQGAQISDMDTFTMMIYNAMADGWNQCIAWKKGRLIV